MSLTTIKPGLGQGGVGVNAPDLKNILTELQGLTVSVIGTGAAANTKMNIAALRNNDTLLSVVSRVIATGATTDDTANCTVQDTHAFGTVTVASAVNADTVTVNGTVYTLKTTPTAAYTDVLVTGADSVVATALAAAINNVEGSASAGRGVTAVAVSAVVTITAAVDGTAGNALTLLSSNGTRLAVTGAGTLTNGTATGGIKSTTNNSASSLLVFWFNKS